MAKKRTHVPLPAPEVVLAGRVQVCADQLFALVHDVNPTGQESPRERERYALKSRLQGLLLTRFGDEVEIHQDPANPDLVSLRHRSGLRDACHALVSQLPVEARALVHRRLDMEAGAPAAPVPDGALSRAVRGAAPARSIPPATAEDSNEPGSLHARGLTALEAYDYEEAQRLLTEAVERGAGADAARALLELLVDLLADDEGAMGLGPRLTPAAASDATVRGLLGLAAARTGEAERASRLVRGLSGSPAARVHATLGRTALDAGDLARAAGHLSNAKLADPDLPETTSLEAALEHARQNERKPAEEALLALHTARDRDAAETSARALLSRWPDSASGRRVLREIEETRRRERARALSRDGAAALDRGEAAEAVRLLSQALAADPDAAGVSDLLSRARQDAASQADEAALRKVVAALATPALHEGLVAFAELPAVLRARVRAVSPEPRLALVEEVLSFSPSEKPRAAVDAALALASAEDALHGDDPAAVLRLLEKHARALAKVPRAEARTTIARDRIAVGRAARARAALARVRTVLDADAFDDAATLLHEVRKSDLDAEGLTELAVVNGRLREGEAARRSQRAAEAREMVKRSLRVSVSTEPGPADELADFDSLVSHDRTRPCLSADGRRLVLANAFGDWLFVRVVDVERGEVVRRISLRTPHPIGDWENVLVEGDRLTVVGEKLGLVVLDLATAEVVRSLSLAGALPPSSGVEGTLLLPAS
ncbi:MAG TPA: hypothetical protein VE129_14070, partial [Thermoanaerobaculia bacterium]|nr:hypothetical protein [Thermoanaerobaculia bacterium]